MMTDFRGDAGATGVREARRDGASEVRGVRPRLWLIGVLVFAGFAAWFGEQYVQRLHPRLELLFGGRDQQSIREMEAEVTAVLESYGIQEQWVRKAVIVLAEDDTVRDEWTVRVPPNLPVVSVTSDLHMLAAGYEGETFAIENTRTGQVNVHVAFSGMVRYSLLFTPAAELSRQSGKAAILVDGLENAPGGEVEKLLAAVDPVGCILLPDREELDLYEQTRQAGKEVVLHIHFSAQPAPGNRMSFADILSQREIEHKVRAVVRNYPEARYYFTSSDQTPGVSVRIADAKFERQGLRKLDAAAFFYLDRTDRATNLGSRMNDLAEGALRSGSLIGVLSLPSGTMDQLQTEMTRLRKKGLDFVPLHALPDRR